MITLNGTGAFLWQRLEQGASEEELVAAILENYSDVDEDRARRSVEGFLRKLREIDCLE
jgi:hypothetical protein